MKFTDVRHRLIDWDDGPGMVDPEARVMRQRQAGPSGEADEHHDVWRGHPEHGRFMEQHRDGLTGAVAPIDVNDGNHGTTSS